MYNSCEACGEQSTWHPQLHPVTPVSSGCVDEELAAPQTSYSPR